MSFEPIRRKSAKEATSGFIRPLPWSWVVFNVNYKHFYVFLKHSNKDSGKDYALNFIVFNMHLSNIKSYWLCSRKFVSIWNTKIFKVCTLICQRDTKLSILYRKTGSAHCRGCYDSPKTVNAIYLACKDKVWHTNKLHGFFVKEIGNTVDFRHFFLYERRYWKGQIKLSHCIDWLPRSQLQVTTNTPFIFFFAKSPNKSWYF